MTTSAPSAPAASASFVHSMVWRGVVGTGPRQDGDGDGFDHGLPQLAELGVGEDRALAGGARHHEPVAAVTGEPAGQGHGPVDIETALVVEGRDHGRDDRAETRWPG